MADLFADDVVSTRDDDTESQSSNSSLMSSSSYALESATSSQFSHSLTSSTDISSTD